MKKITYISLMAAAFILNACNDEEMIDSPSLPEGNLTIQATINDVGATARTYIHSGTANTLIWNTGDAIGVYGSSVENQKFIATKQSNNANNITDFSGSFSGQDTPKYAYYPYSTAEGEGISGNAWTFTLPSTIAFVPKGNGTQMEIKAPMVAPSYDSENKKLAFNHICGLMRVTISAIPTNATSLVVTSSNQNIAGKCTISDITAAFPQLTPPSDGGKTVTVTWDAETGYTEKTFYIPLPVATYDKLTVELKDASGKAILTRSTSNLNVSRAQLVDMNKLTALELKPSEVKAALSEALKVNYTTVDVVIKEVATNDATIELPKVDGYSCNVNLIFKETPATKLTIKEVVAKDQYIISKVTVKLSGSKNYDGSVWTETPVWKDVAGAPDFDITLSGTVILDSNDENKIAHYGNVSLSGSYSSYIGSQLKGNITVNSLNVLAGTNIHVTGTVGKITIPADNSTTNQVLINKESNNPNKGGYCYEFENLSQRAITYKSLPVWDGTSKCKPLTDKSGQYLIRSAAELAYFQPTGVPISSTAGSIPATMNADAKLCCDINLNSQPWLGMVLGENAIFDGGNHTISNVKITSHVVNEADINSTESCVGLFAATLTGSQIKDIEISGFNATGVDAKWCGALVGYSRGTTLYSNCKATDVTIKSEKANAFRIGGLIGFIGGTGGSDPAVVIDHCSASKVDLQGSYSIGGLVGTIQGSGARTIQNSQVVEPVKIALNDASCALHGGFIHRPSTKTATYYAPKEYVGNVGKFIGDLASSITLTDNTVPARFTAGELTAFGFDKVIEGNAVKKENVEALTDEIKKEMKSSLVPTGTYSLEDAKSGLIPAQTSAEITITIGGATLTSGNDYNLFTKQEEE